MQQQDAVAPCPVDVVAVDVVIDVAGPLQNQVAVHAAVDLVFLEEGSRAAAHVHPAAERGRDLVQQDVRMAVRFQLYAHLLVELQGVIGDVGDVARAPDQQPPFLVLGQQVETYHRPALLIHFGVAADPIVRMSHQIVLHDFGAAVLDLDAHLALPDLVVDEVAAVAEQRDYPQPAALAYDVVLDRAAEGAVEDQSLAAVGHY